MSDQNLIPVHISDLTIAPSLSEFDYFLGIKYDSSTQSYINYRYRVSDLISYIGGSISQKITATTVSISTTTNQDDTLLNIWFSGKIIEEISTRGGTLLLDQDFTQDDNKIILTTSFWEDDQKLRAKT